jgi:hypothetical protein
MKSNNKLQRWLDGKDNGYLQNLALDISLKVFTFMNEMQI